MTDKTVTCITLPLLKLYSVSSVANSNLYAQQSTWLLITMSQKCSLSELSQNLFAEIMIRP